MKSKEKNKKESTLTELIVGTVFMGGLIYFNDKLEKEKQRRELEALERLQRKENERLLINLVLGVSLWGIYFYLVHVEHTNIFPAYLGGLIGAYYAGNSIIDLFINKPWKSQE
ncbi:hypothetical protein [uncultured Tenacibaculum sp.]|uniref:hypothetical protein n=1 Tax=uncultured Tenacibaculum sp. TaxID=174713 RepID=UPI00261B9D6F|nr:hypothetical protein [uncultured Tenacibaculum sp.]